MRVEDEGWMMRVESLSFAIWTTILKTTVLVHHVRNFT